MFSYPDVDPNVLIKAKIVAAKFGARSYPFCKVVTTWAPDIPSAIAIRATAT